MTIAAPLVRVEAALPYERILLTGGNGFVGGHLLSLLRTRLSENAVLVCGGRGEEGTDILLDLAQPSSVALAVKKVRPDLLVHLAGEASVATAAQAASETWKINLTGSLALAAAMSEISPDCTVLFASSAEVYGLAFLEGTVGETTVPRPQSVYGQSKLAAEQMLASVLPTSAKLMVARPTNHIGPMQSDRFAISSFAKQLAASELLSQRAEIHVGNLNAERDFMDVRDVVDAYMALLALPLDVGARELFNISSGTPRSLRDMLDVLRGAATVASDIVIDDDRFRPNEIERAAVDAERIRLRTGWKPAIPIARSLEDTLDDWRNRCQ